jgi:hypothetical protein
MVVARDRRSAIEESVDAGRRAAARDRLSARGLDPDGVAWAVVPSNPADERPLSEGAVADFMRHLRTVLDGEPGAGSRTVGLGGSGLTPESPLDDALGGACVACRGWCCRRGGTHAFLDGDSTERVRRERPDLDTAALEHLYARYLGPTHLEGGCVFQGPLGCRLPRELRSDTCNRWWCEDATRIREQWDGGTLDPESTVFVAVSPSGSSG